MKRVHLIDAAEICLRPVEQIAHTTNIEKQLITDFKKTVKAVIKRTD